MSKNPSVYSTIEISSKLLDKANADLELAKIILNTLEHVPSELESEMRARVIYSLQQACEKTLKAYFLSTFISGMIGLSAFIREQEDRKAGYGKCVSLLKRSRNYTRPKAFGHGFEGFFNYIAELSREYTYGRMKEYMILLFKRMAENINYAIENGNVHLSDNEKAFVQDSFKIIISLFEDVSDNPSSNLPETESNVQQVHITKDKKEKNRHLRSPKYPCLKATSKEYLGLSKQLEGEFERLKTDVNLTPENIENLAGVVFPESFSKLDVDIVFQAVIDSVKPILAIPLHICLSKYEASSRYPDEWGIPEEDLELGNLNTAVNAVEDLLKSTSRLLPLSSGEDA